MEISPVKKLSLSMRCKKSRLKWAEHNLKVNFSKVLFADEARGTLDGPDGWSKGWVVDGRDCPHC